MNICNRCYDINAEYEIEVPFQEEKIPLCKDCYLLVWELFGKWLNIRGWHSKLLKLEDKLEGNNGKIKV